MADKFIIDDLSNKLQVSRETIDNLIKFRNFLLINNKKINLISKNDEIKVDHRHIYDSAQVIDLINKNDKKVVDLGSGSGFPGIVLAILAKFKKMDSKFYFIEKSKRKSDFLMESIKLLNLNAVVVNKDIANLKDLEADVVTARAFKSADLVFEILLKNFKNYKNLVLFLGKKGKQILLDTSKAWDLEYKQRMSFTNNDSLIVNIKKIKKKIE